MNYAYDSAAWHDFYLCTGGAAAALAGLLFVALSLRLDAVLHHHRARGRATACLLTLLYLLALSLMVLIPGQPVFALGLELALAGASMVVIALFNEHRTAVAVGGHGIGVKSLAFMFTGTRLLANVGCVLLLVSGISLTAREGGGLSLLPVAVLILFGHAVLSAWRLMLGLAEEEVVILEEPSAVHAEASRGTQS